MNDLLKREAFRSLLRMGISQQIENAEYFAVITLENVNNRTEDIACEPIYGGTEIQLWLQDDDFTTFYREVPFITTKFLNHFSIDSEGLGLDGSSHYSVKRIFYYAKLDSPTKDLIRDYIRLSLTPEEKENFELNSPDCNAKEIALLMEEITGTLDTKHYQRLKDKLADAKATVEAIKNQIEEFKEGLSDEDKLKLELL